eukprot:s638_g12.t3
MNHAITQEGTDVASAYSAVLEVLRMTGRIILMVLFTLLQDPACWWVVALMPSLMILFGLCRGDAMSKVTRVSGTVREAVVAFVSECCDKYSLIAEYSRRPAMSDIFEKKANLARLSVIPEQQVALNNNYFPQWLGPTFIGAYIAFFSESVLDGSTSMGVFLAIISVISDMTNDFEGIFIELMSINTRIDSLKVLTHFFNMESELTILRKLNLQNRELSIKARREVLKLPEPPPETGLLRTCMRQIKAIPMPGQANSLTTYATASNAGDIAVKEEQIQEMRAQQKPGKIVKAAKREDHLSPEFQALVHEEQKKDNKECVRNLHAAGFAVQKAKKHVIKIENSRCCHEGQESTESEETRGYEETFRCWCRRRGDPNDARRRERGDGGRGAAEGRECPAHPGEPRMVSSLTLLSEAADKLEPRAKRPRKDRGRVLACVYAAFWQGQHMVTDMHECRKPLPVCEPSSCTLQWGRSILQEETFISPWAAIEHASDLAYELGFAGPIRIDSISLLVRRKNCTKSVHFADHVHVHGGLDADVEFLTLGDFDAQSDIIGRLVGQAGQPSGPTVHPRPRQMPKGDTGGSASGSEAHRI